MFIYTFVLVTNNISHLTTTAEFIEYQWIISIDYVAPIRYQYIYTWTFIFMWWDGKIKLPWLLTIRDIRLKRRDACLISSALSRNWKSYSFETSSIIIIIVIIGRQFHFPILEGYSYVIGYTLESIQYCDEAGCNTLWLLWFHTQHI